MHPLLLPILATTGKPSVGATFLSAFPYLLGMLVVMITLAILWGLCELTAKLIQRFLPEAEPATGPAAPPVTHDAPVPRAAAATGTPPELVAAIAAAVHTLTGGDYRVVAIKPQDPSWEKAGRQSVLSSHRIR
jgi:sodium pump decarboxylase gamma subunit